MKRTVFIDITLIACFFSLVSAQIEDIHLRDSLQILLNQPFNISRLFFVEEVESDAVKFFLHTDRKSKAINLFQKFDSFDPKHPLKIIIHGWFEDANTEWYQELIDEYFRKGNKYNIVTVDWSKLGRTEYILAIRNLKAVGGTIADLILKLVEAHKIPYKNVHLIGHSLGAHVAGFAGKAIYSAAGQKIGRITALDAARPMFEIPPTDPRLRLTKTDATFVDVVHTDGGMFGCLDSFGTADFFPNGGFLQPGCAGIRLNFQIGDIFCSHSRSHEYFAESINNDFFAKRCDDWFGFEAGLCDNVESIVFGENVPTNTAGNYYFRTGFQRPYYL